ncbi:hypothetical protein ACHAWF_004771 [Thalassiosira exigua]
MPHPSELEEFGLEVEHEHQALVPGSSSSAATPSPSPTSHRSPVANVCGDGSRARDTPFPTHLATPSKDQRSLLESTNFRPSRFKPHPGTLKWTALVLLPVVVTLLCLGVERDEVVIVEASLPTSGGTKPSRATANTTVPTDAAEQPITQCPDLITLANERSQCATSRSSRAAGILKAQKLSKGFVFPDASADQASLAPVWALRRDAFFGLWIWPRLKLVLFACPKCGNSQIRSMLSAMSEEVQKSEEEDTMAVKPPGHWIRSSQNNHSWAAKDGSINCKKNILTAQQNDDAYQHVGELFADPQWSSLGIVRHPYDRLTSGYAELEFRWGNFQSARENGNLHQHLAPSMEKLDASTYWHQEEAKARALAFWSDYVHGNFYVTDPASNCLNPIAETYHLSPIGSFFLKDSGTCEAASLFTVDDTIDIDNVSQHWPQFIKRWDTYWDDDVAEKLVGMANEHGNTKAASVPAQTMKQLLKENTALRESVDAFYNLDFTHFGFVKGSEKLITSDGQGESNGRHKARMFAILSAFLSYWMV